MAQIKVGSGRNPTTAALQVEITDGEGALMGLTPDGARQLAAWLFAEAAAVECQEATEAVLVRREYRRGEVNAVLHELRQALRST